MAKLWNVALTCVLLFVALVAWLASVYDGYCYGFTDGSVSCSLAEHIEANLDWLPLLLVYFFPHVIVIGGLVYLVNDVMYRAVVRMRARRGLED